MNKSALTRRRFLNQSAQTGIAGILASGYFPYLADAAKEAPSERLRFGAIGVGGRGAGVANGARRLADIVAICDLDTQRIESRNKALAQGKAKGYQDYRKVLDRKDIDFVTIGTTDHWHTRVAIQAMQSGKDVYCEKPLTLTIEEGKQICKVAKETGRVFQVGTQQRSEMGQKFLTAIGIIREGRIGKIQKVTCNIGGGPKGGPFKKSDPPANLDWNTWLGQAPKVDYIKERCHYQFRWWYEYSGGKMTDWGAHHVDIAQWALDQSGEGQGVSVPRSAHRGSPDTLEGRHADQGQPLQHLAQFPYQVHVPRGHRNEHRQQIEGRKRHLVRREQGQHVRLPRKAFRRCGQRPQGKAPVFRHRIRSLQRQEDDQPHGELLRLHEGQDRSDFRRLHPSPGNDHLPLGQHLDPPGSQDQMGSEKGAGRG